MAIADCYFAAAAESQSLIGIPTKPRRQSLCAICTRLMSISFRAGQEAKGGKIKTGRSLCN